MKWKWMPASSPARIAKNTSIEDDEKFNRVSARNVFPFLFSHNTKS